MEAQSAPEHAMMARTSVKLGINSIDLHMNTLLCDAILRRTCEQKWAGFGRCDALDQLLEPPRQGLTMAL